MDGMIEVQNPGNWVRMATPTPRTYNRVTPEIHPAGQKQAFNGTGDQDGPDAVRDMMGPAFWRFLAVHDDDFSTREGFSRVKRGSAVMSSEPQFDAVLDFCADYSRWCLALREKYDPTSEEARLLLGEEEHARKATVMGGYYEGYHHPPPSPKRINLPGWYSARLEEVLSLYLTETDPRTQLIPLPKYVIPTSAGWPTFQPGIGCKVLGAAFYQRGRTFDELRDAAAHWAARVGLDPVTTLCNGYGTRTGTNIKLSPTYDYDGVSFVSRQMMESRFCRRRQIYMAPLLNVTLLRRFTRIAKATRYSVIPGAWHAGDSDDVLMRALAGTPGEWWEADISGYDVSLSRDHHFAVQEAIRRRRPDLSAAISDYVGIDDVGTIFPHPGGHGANNRRGRVVTRSGLLSSGILPTAEMGNIYHLPIIWELAARCGFAQPFESLIKREWGMLIQGDDLLLKMKGLSSELMEETYAEAGLKVKALQANRFLMRHRFQNGWYPVCSRIMQQTFSPEHETLGKWALPIAVMGFVARQEGHPAHSLVQAKLSEFMALTDLGRLGITDLKTGQAWLSSSKGSALVATALEKLASSSWVRALIADAEYSPQSRAILALATKFGLVPQAMSEDDVGNRAIEALHSMPIERMHRIRDALWLALNDGLGGTHLDALALELIFGKTRNTQLQTTSTGDHDGIQEMAE